jgi:apolipoprotein N-acyltransferase
MRQNSSGCVTGFLAGFSRFFLIFAWIARPVYFSTVFNGSWILPCLGILILPFTTLMYAILVTNGTRSISGLDWLWLFLAVVIDVAAVGAAGAANRNQIPQGYPGALPPEPPATPPAAPTSTPPAPKP